MLGLQTLVLCSLAAGFNFITTIINMRAPGMHFMRMPIFTWMSFVVQFLLVLAFPVITIALVFLQFDRFFGTTFYLTAAGGDPLSTERRVHGVITSVEPAVVTITSANRTVTGKIDPARTNSGMRASGASACSVCPPRWRSPVWKSYQSAPAGR